MSNVDGFALLSLKSYLELHFPDLDASKLSGEELIKMAIEKFNFLFEIISETGGLND